MYKISNDGEKFKPKLVVTRADVPLLNQTSFTMAAAPALKRVKDGVHDENSGIKAYFAGGLRIKNSVINVTATLFSNDDSIKEFFASPEHNAAMQQVSLTTLIDKERIPITPEQKITEKYIKESLATWLVNSGLGQDITADQISKAEGHIPDDINIMGAFAVEHDFAA